MKNYLKSERKKHPLAPTLRALSRLDTSTAQNLLELVLESLNTLQQERVNQELYEIEDLGNLSDKELKVQLGVFFLAFCGIKKALQEGIQKNECRCYDSIFEEGIAAHPALEFIEAEGIELPPSDVIEAVMACIELGRAIG
jgi:hypothetical protein